MKLQNHLLYIDITQFCGIGCDFCMYTEKHAKSHLKLSSKAITNLSRLINDPEVKRISVSGEGEPLNNIQVFYQILALSKGNRKFEFITSGYLEYKKLRNALDEIDRIVSVNGDECNIRLSSDSHHIPKLKHQPHGKCIRDFKEGVYDNLTLSFRSIDPDREFTRQYLIDQAQDFGFNAEIKVTGDLEDVVHVEGTEFRVDYKNLVKPNGMYDNYLSMWQYIQCIEDKVGKPFTLGSLNIQENGLDVTIKPNGDVFLYGLEIRCLGNIHTDQISYKLIKDVLLSNEVMRKLYEEPFRDVIFTFGDRTVIDKAVEKVNNPYWLMKEIYTEISLDLAC
ncbi:4Fe-4S cluster-binding domain-containing protein [Vibrio parahaemolyticus]|nr:4Fe-4S cluster-binding domain-containing protein [Vibrio parahaemolyticus]EJG1860971.1 4Fe-4S cluster-binding domain-containing protein [Vibrio parahaemolyticus]EJG2000969.1 4Fe-4S cluster-binding domain-containing protein [Vibrio parahaemolyticus]EJG2036683.1 4Fe-4S cluster-binding domain-containing protein [Vibrio parahaemolyticus]EJG2042580.1 4Fe-4S cluster-binding domain-containing protein [Vibrio parahaemolyticus]